VTDKPVAGSDDLLTSAKLAVDATKLFPVFKPKTPRKPRKPRRPTLASVAKQANKAAIEVKQYEVKPDGTVVIVPGKPEVHDKFTAKDEWNTDKLQ
jgi:hypothetical protein